MNQQEAKERFQFEVVTEPIKRGSIRIVFIRVHNCLATEYLRRVFLVAVVIGFLGTAFLMQKAHYINFKKYFVDLPQLMEFSHFLADKQYTCLQEKQYKSSEDVIALCLEKDFWPNNYKKQNCVIYSFTGNSDFTIEKKLGFYFGCSVHIFKPAGGTVVKHKNVEVHRLGIFHQDKSLFGPNNWRMLTLESIQKHLNHTEQFLSVFVLDIDGLYRNGYVERILEEILRSGIFRCIGQMQITFRLKGRIFDHFVELKRMKGILSIMTRYYSVGYRTFSVTNNLRKGKDLMTSLMFAPLPVTWKVAYVNMRLNGC